MEYFQKIITLLKVLKPDNDSIVWNVTVSVAQLLLAEGLTPKGRQIFLLLICARLICNTNVFPAPFTAQTPQILESVFRNSSIILVDVNVSNRACVPVAFSASGNQIDSPLIPCASFFFSTL